MPATATKPQTFQITFSINGTDYRVFPLAADPDVAERAYRFRKGDGTTYDAMVSPEGHASCDCPDCTFRQRACKHLRCLAAAGMIPKAAVA